MFGIKRQEVLRNSRWEPRDLQLAYIEAFSYPNNDVITPENYYEGYLQDSEVGDWLSQQRSFIQPNNPDLGTSNGMIRLLICERIGWQPLGFSMSQESFLAMEQEFELPSGTLQVLRSHSGHQSCQFRYSLADPQCVESVSILLKVPQMYQYGNYCLALTHTFETGVTLAFLHGWGLLTDFNHVTRAPMIPHAERIQELVKATISLWTHPLLLPVILLEEHIFRAKIFDHELSSDTVKIESRLSVTFSGRLSGSKAMSANELKALMADDDARIDLTTFLNTTTTNTINAKDVLEWQGRFCQFLHRASDRIFGFGLETLIRPGRELKESIDILESTSVSLLTRTNTLRARLDLQLNVLYNFVAQADSSYTLKMAAGTGLDSVAMKTLAFVTTVFLPPTFIAGLFSMSVFNWQASSGNDSSQSTGGDEAVVGKLFWIYWAISIPLTLVVLFSWRIWWHFQKAYYQREFPHANKKEEASTTSSSAIRSSMKSIGIRRR